MQATTSSSPIDTDNSAFRQAAALVLETDEHVFLTGKAGSGKTTFLRHITSITTKKYAVVAPTGIAAVNAGGETLHSFLQLPLGPYLPLADQHQIDGQFAHNRQSLLSQLRLRETKIAMLRKLELLIIDEVSMLRADLLDAADTVLRHARKAWHLPFGGVQMLFIGDLYQLPPVIPQQEWELLRSCYQGLYFFDALVFQECKPVNLSLTKIYRQNDEHFISLLNRVRTGTHTPADMTTLNHLYHPNSTVEAGFVVLCTHNQIADDINRKELQQLSGKNHDYTGTLKGDLNLKNLPVDEVIALKTGAQVMFTKNDLSTPKRYYNGKIGVITALTTDEIWVNFPDKEEEKPIKVEKDVWRNIRYVLNTTTGQIEEEELGSFSQYPLRLAWAITVHKSQGLTLEKVMVDLSRSFAPGQVYVALSRCTTLQGIRLLTPIQAQHILTDRRIVTYMPDMPEHENGIEELLTQARHKALLHKIIRNFNFDELLEQLTKTSTELSKKKSGPVKEALALCTHMQQQVTQAAEVANRFHSQAQYLFDQNQYDILQKRANDACRYFSEQMLIPVAQQVNDQIRTYDGLSGVTKQVKAWSQLQRLLHQQLDVLTTTFT